MKFGFDPILATLFGLLVGLAIGAINGALIAYVRIAPFIVTLAMLSFARGLILILTEGWPITQYPSPSCRSASNFLSSRFRCGS